MPLPSRSKLIVISEHGISALAAAQEHFEGSHGVHHANDTAASALSAVHAKLAPLHEQRQQLIEELMDRIVERHMPDDVEPPLTPDERAQLDAANAAIEKAHHDERFDVATQAVTSAPWIGVVYPKTVDAIDSLAALSGVHVASERDPDPLSPDLLKLVSHVTGVTMNETGFSLARKLHRHYEATYFRPEF